MMIYVDPLMQFGWVIRGARIANCHLFTDSADLDELHRFAEGIGLKRAWFQGKASVPHYDLTPRRRAAAVKAGAVEVDRRQAVAIWRAWRAKAAA